MTWTPGESLALIGAAGSGGSGEETEEHHTGSSMTSVKVASNEEARQLGQKLSDEYHVNSRTSCSTCHR
jgi:hypothetical protein